MDINELYDWVLHVEDFLEEKQRIIASEILKEIRTRLKFLLDVGLDYLSLNRSSVSLSGGESQRIRLATQIGSQLGNVLYILDEPTTGLHTADVHRLIEVLQRLTDTGNTVVVIEHNLNVIKVADWIVDLGLVGVFFFFFFVVCCFFFFYFFLGFFFLFFVFVFFYFFFYFGCCKI